MSTSPSKTFVQPYLFFDGRCEEALEFYKATLGIEIEALMRFKDCPEPPPENTVPAGYGEKIMHSSFKLGSSTLMASDGCGESHAFQSFTLALNLPDEAECQRVFDALAEGGKVCMPLNQTFWSPCFGMVEDQFGLSWMITVA